MPNQEFKIRTTESRGNTDCVADKHRASVLALVRLVFAVAVCVTFGIAFTGCLHDTSPNPFTPIVRAQSCDSCSGACSCNGHGASQGQFESEISGREIFLLNCASCHEGRSVIERPYSQTVVSFSHARKHAYLTGAEYRKLVSFLREWHGLAQ